MKLAYLTNQYPRVSHSFIRREILGLEARGLPITRFSIRRPTEDIPDPLDRQEATRTQFLLDKAAGEIAASVLRTAVTRPWAFARALRLALKMGWGSQRGMARHVAYLAEACLLRELCAAQGITHLHVHHATNPAAVAVLCSLLGGPRYSVSVHGPEEFENAAQLALSEKLERAEFIVCVSEYGRRELARWCDAGTRAKMHVIHCGLDQTLLEHLPRALPDVSRLLWVGRFVEQKDPLALVRVIAQLRAQNVLCKVTMVGDGPLRGAVEREIVTLGLRETITVAGWASGNRILELLRGSRGLVLSSRAENIPSVLMEALAQERPVVSTNVGGIAELVEDGEMGWLVPPDAPEALALAIRCALETDVARLNEMGKKGRQRVLAQFTTALQAEQLLQLYS